MNVERIRELIAAYEKLYAAEPDAEFTWSISDQMGSTRGVCPGFMLVNMGVLTIGTMCVKAIEEVLGISEIQGDELFWCRNVGQLGDYMPAFAASTHQSQLEFIKFTLFNLIATGDVKWSVDLLINRTPNEPLPN